MDARTRTRLVRLTALTAVLAGAAGLAAACGARSGLDVPFGGPPGTRTTDGGLHTDADATFDAGVDAGRDVAPPPPGLDCAEAGVTYIYVIGEDNSLYAFHPDSGEFELKGVIHCPAPEGSSPFSMAVDHRGVAYVVFSTQGDDTPGPGNGALFRVSTATAACEATPFKPGQQGIITFGMGFAANSTDAGIFGETLYVAGDSNDSLAIIDVNTFELTPVAPLGEIDGIRVSETELTGTGTGGLYGFFAQSPDDGGPPESPPAYIVHLDTKTGGVVSGVELPDVGLGDGWAFGFWGGDFYTFTASDGVTTEVTRYRPSDGSIVQVAMAPPGVLIVGSGVSTCAPQE